MKSDRHDIEFIVFGAALVVFVVLLCALAVLQ